MLGRIDFRKRTYGPTAPPFPASTIASVPNMPRRINHNRTTWWFNGLAWVPLPKDPYISNVLMLVHGDEFTTDGALIQRGYGGATYPTGCFPATNQTKFANYSLYTSNISPYISGGRIYSPAIASYALGTGDFTIEFWMYPTSIGLVALFDMGFGSNTRPYVYMTALGSLRYYVNSADRITGASNTIVANAWHFIQVVRESAVTTLRCNGTRVGSTWSDTVDYTAGIVALGASTTGATPTTGYWQDLRITKGVARPNVVPTMPFSDF